MAFIAFTPANDSGQFSVSVVLPLYFFHVTSYLGDFRGKAPTLPVGRMSLHLQSRTWRTARDLAPVACSAKLIGLRFEFHSFFATFRAL
jgi:hypothetical protein